MTIPRVVRGAARALSKESEYESSATPDEGRAETVSAIKQALRDRAAAKRRRRVIVPVIAVVAVAASVALVATVATKVGKKEEQTASPAPVPTQTAPAPAAFTADTVEGAVSVVSTAGATTSLANGASVRTGDRVVSTDGSATIRLPSGSRVDLERATDLRVDVGRGAQVVELASGAVTSRVAKVAPDDRFLVRSGDVEVEVRGTVFRVERVNGGPCVTRTKVSVTEGRVVVRAHGTENVLGAGDAWESTCNEPSASPTTTAVPSARPIPTTTAVPTTSTPSSDLSVQNALFGEAMAAKSRGDTGSAVAQLDSFMKKYPNSPLHEAAAVQRMRLLASSDRARATVAAREYVARYPTGFGRKEADRLLEKNDESAPQK